MPVKSSDQTVIGREKHVEDLEREVAELHEQLRRSQRLATVGTMAAMVAHEFNNILTPVINYAQLAKKNPAMIAKAIARAEEGGLRATEICSAIMGLTDDRKPTPSRFDLNELVEKTITVMARDPHQDRINIAVDIPANFVIFSEQIELEQVLLNLLLNARNAVLAGNGPRRIDITASKDYRRVIIEIADSGIGIESDNLDMIFSPFFTTAVTDDPNATGHGLGLTVCREIIRSLGGEISVKSTKGVGSVFAISLPDAAV